ncbi:MAG: hypothetical protein J5682_08475 [Prevotella sp.]|nr:hypothetical protein [Prevotella sp.]
MRKLYKTMLLLMVATVGMGTFVSCNDDDDLAKADALFRPIISDDNIEMGLDDNLVPYMNVKWDNYTDANQYTISVEPADGSVAPKEITTSELSCHFDGLEYDKEYFIYISAANTNTGLKSKAYSLTATTPDYPTSLSTLQATDIIDIAVRVRWTPGVYYDRLRILNDDGEVVTEVTLTEEDNAAAQKVVYGLSPKTSYRVEAYAGDSYKGKKRFTTAASELFSGEVIDLRGLDEDTAWKWFSVGSGSAYTNTLDSLIKNGYQDKDITIVLEGGTKYRIATIELPSTTGTITFVTGLSLAGEAQMGVEGNFRVAGSSEVGGVVFDKIFFTDTENKPRTDSHYGATYIFNMNQSGGNIGTVKFTNCSIKYKRGICRIQTAATIQNVIIDNCIIDSISGYGITNADNGKADIQNVKITNTTVSNAEKICVGTKGLQPNSLVVENCTFVYTIADAKPFFDFKSSNWSSFQDKFVFKNCLIGMAGRNKEELATTGISGWRQPSA